MYPLGPHIEISAYEELIESPVIVERELVVRAKVLKVSPDITTPFGEGSTIYFYRSRVIPIAGTRFITLEMVVGFGV